MKAAIKEKFHGFKYALTNGLSIGNKQFIIPAIDVLIATKPEFLPSWILIRGFYGSLFEIKQEEINEFVGYIQKNKKFFSAEIVQTKEFRDGFVITFEQYIKQRKENKRKMIQNIFLGFTASNSKEDFELERYYDLLNKISDFQFYLIEKVRSNSKLVVKDKERNIVEYHYSDLKYLEYIGILDCFRKSHVDADLISVDYNGSGDVDVDLTEEETFELSLFGQDFLHFILSDFTKD